MHALTLLTLLLLSLVLPLCDCSVVRRGDHDNLLVYWRGGKPPKKGAEGGGCLCAEAFEVNYIISFSIGRGVKRSCYRNSQNLCNTCDKMLV